MLTMATTPQLPAADDEDPVRRLVRFKLVEQGLDMAEISRQMERNPAYIQQYLERGSPKWLPEGPSRQTLARLLGVDESDLKRPATVESAGGRAIQSSQIYKLMSPATGSANSPNPVPVMGTGAGGADGETEWNGEIVEYIARPQALVGVPGAYAVYVWGDSVSPRYKHGELVVMHPNRPISKGSFVFVQLGEPSDSDGPTKRAIIKEFVRQTSTKLVLAQLNPPKQIEIDIARVKRIHRIVASSEP